MAWYEKTVDLIIKGIRWEVTIAALAASGVLLFFAQQLKVETWAGQYRGVEITIFVFSGCLLLASTITAIGRPIAVGWQGLMARRRSKKHLHQLNPEEKKHCKYFVDHDGDPIADNPANGGLASLVANGIVWQSEKGWNWMFHFSIYPWALAYLKRHPELLKGAKEH